MIVGQGPIALAVGADGGCLDFFYSPLSFLSSFSFSLGDGRYRLKYCLKGPLNPKQPTNQPTINKSQHATSKITKEPKQKGRLGTASTEITGGLQLVCSRPTLALNSALVPQIVVWFAWKIPSS